MWDKLLILIALPQMIFISASYWLFCCRLHCYHWWLQRRIAVLLNMQDCTPTFDCICTLNCHGTVNCHGAADCIVTLVMVLLIVSLLYTIKLAVNPSPAVASTGSPIIYLQYAVAIANHSSILFWFWIPRHYRKRMPLEHDWCCITMQWTISWLHLKSSTCVRGRSEWC